MSPVSTQSAGCLQLTLTAAPPPTGVAVTVNRVKGPPPPGALALSAAVVGEVALTDEMVGDLQTGGVGRRPN